MFIEPQSAFAARLITTRPSTQSNLQVMPAMPSRPADRSGDYWTQILVETLQLDRNMPVQIASLVSSAAKWGDYATRADRQERKLELFKLVGQLIKKGRLRRIARNYVVLATDDEMKRHQESLQQSAPPVDFPKPNV